MKKEKISSFTILTLTVLVVFFTSNYHLLLTTDVENTSIFLILINLVLVRPLYLFIKDSDYLKNIKIDKVFIVLWLVFGFTIFLSEIYHGQYRESIFFLYLVPLIYFIFLNKIYKLEELHLINFFSTAPFLLVALLFVVTKHKFSTNTIALIVLFALISLICLDKFIVKNKSFIVFFIYQIFLGILFIILAGINSRTSMLTFIIAYVVNMVLNIVWLNKNKKEEYKKYYVFYILVLIVGLLGVYFVLNHLSSMLYKWGGDISSNRFTLWEITIEKMKTLGLGYDFYIKTQDPDPTKYMYSLKGPHNMFFGVLGYTGILTFILFIIINIKYLKDIIVNFTKNDLLFKNRDVLVFGIAYFISGMLEGFLQTPFYRPANYIWFIIIGGFYLIKNNDVSITSHGIDNRGEISSDKKSVYILYLVIIIMIALVSVVIIPGDGNLLKISKTILRYIK